MKRILPIVLCLLGALVFYSLGFSGGAVALIAVGMAFELGFWVLALRGFRSSSST